MAIAAAIKTTAGVFFCNENFTRQQLTPPKKEKNVAKLAARLVYWSIMEIFPFAYLSPTLCAHQDKTYRYSDIICAVIVHFEVCVCVCVCVREG